MTTVRLLVALPSSVVAGAVIMGSTELVDKSMAAALAPGSVASLNYGNKISTLRFKQYPLYLEKRLSVS